MHFLQAATVFTTCCILHFTVTTISGHHAGTTFTIEPTSPLYVDIGSDVTFYWQFSFGDAQDRNNFEEIYWGETDGNEKIRNKYTTVLHDGRVIDNDQLDSSLQSRLGSSGNITNNSTNQAFVLQRVTESDYNKTYGCQATVYGDWFRSGPIRLVQQVSPSITVSTNSMNFNDGKRGILECDAAGVPAPLVEWSKDGSVLQLSQTITSFTIANVTPQDAGTYTCTATNPAGSVYITLQVTVGS